MVALFGQMFDPYPTREEYFRSIGGVSPEQIDSGMLEYESRIDEVEKTNPTTITIEYFSAKEIQIISQVAVEYDLTDHETALLFAIRKCENGRPGLEFGCGDGIDNHPARRYAGDFERSLRLQAQWCAGTIKKRYKGDVGEFSKIYCPTNAVNWERMVESWVGKLS